MSNRNGKGQFTKGNKLGIGRPKRSVEEQYVTALSETLSVTQWKRIIKRTIADAAKGDARARELLFKHVLGTSPMVTLEQNIQGSEPVLTVNWEGAQEIIERLDHKDGAVIIGENAWD